MTVSEKLATRAAQKMNPGQSVINPAMMGLFMELIQMLMDKCQEKNGTEFTMDKFKDNASQPTLRHKLWARRQARIELHIRGKENREMIDASISAVDETSTEELQQFSDESEAAGMLR